MSLSKELAKCFVCFQPTEKFGKTENTFLSVVMLLRMEGHLPYPPKGSPVIIKDWDPCETCVPKTLDLYKEYTKLQEKMKERRERRQRVREARIETAITENKETSSKVSNDEMEKEAKVGANNSEDFSGLRLRKRRNKNVHYTDPEEEEASTMKKRRRTEALQEEGCPPKRFKCPRCPSHFATSYIMYKHIRFVHEKDRPFKCSKCPLKLSFNRHVVAAHGKNGSLKCPHCPSLFQVSRVLSRHIQTAHSNKQKTAPSKVELEGEEEVPQQEGPRSLNKAQKNSSLSTNRKKGNDKESFNCPQCPISVTRSRDLKRHIRTVHEGIRAFKCPHCCKSFTEGRFLRDHVGIVHEGRALYKCPRPNCKSTFACKQRISLHVAAVHEKRRDFKCHICRKGFFRKDECATHVREAHGKKGEKEIK